MAIEQIRPEIIAIEDRLVRVYRQLQLLIDSELAGLVNDPLRMRRRARLVELRDRVALFIRQVDVQAAAWVNRDLPAIYAMGLADGSIAANVFSQIDRATVSRLANDTMADLLAATRHVEADVKALVRRVAADEALAKVSGVRSVREASQRMAEVIEQRGVNAIVYSNGAEVGVDTYSEMVIRTKTAIAYNRGVLDGAGGTEFFECFDGLACGWTEHDDPDLANGKIVSADEAADNIVAHPNCRRAFSPRPDIRDAEHAVASRGGVLPAV